MLLKACLDVYYFVLQAGLVKESAEEEMKLHNAMAELEGAEKLFGAAGNGVVGATGNGMRFIYND